MKLVEDELNKFIPKELRDQIDRQRTDLLALQVKIHNSLSTMHIDSAALNCNSFANTLPREAKRANSFIITQKHFNETLQPLLNEKGHASDIFPKSVNDLLEFDSQSNPLNFNLMVAHSLGPQMQRFCNW